MEDSEKKVYWSGLGAASLNIAVSGDGSRLLYDWMIKSDECVRMDEEEWYRVKFELSVSLQMCKGAGGFFV